MERKFSLGCNAVDATCYDHCSLPGLINDSFLGEKLYDGGFEVQVYFKKTKFDGTNYHKGETLTVIKSTDSKDNPGTCSMHVWSKGPEERSIIDYISKLVEKEKGKRTTQPKLF